jgi:hypothetical protein
MVVVERNGSESTMDSLQMMVVERNSSESANDTKRTMDLIRNYGLRYPLGVLGEGLRMCFLPSFFCFTHGMVCRAFGFCFQDGNTQEG